MDREDNFDLIRRCGTYMKKQLQKEVADYLLDQDVITQAEYEEIQSHRNREHQIERLLDFLPSKRRDKFLLFLKYVNQWYGWIFTECKYYVESDYDDFAEIEKVLEEGDVPPPPVPCVSRNEEFARLSGCLRELKKHEYVVVHGMRGCGKTTLLIDVLRRSRSLVIDAFKKRVFWLTVGRASLADQLALLQELCRKAASHHGYNVPPIPLDARAAKNFLRKKFQNEDWEDCLLVLDDVSSDSVIDALDIGCKIVVTTDDKTIMNKTQRKVHYEKISDGFTEVETLNLFSNRIECKSEQLPPQAKHIHTICKGFPLTISLLSSQLAEHREAVLQIPNRWDSYVSKLKEKDIQAAIGRFDQHRQEQVSSLYKAIGLSIDSLNASLKEYYQDFALFMDDVNINPEVLCVLWQLNMKDVEDIMVVFERKSLAVRAYNRTKNTSYIYCVHDLLLDYLKRQLTSQERKDLHRKLITAYQQRFGTDLYNFPVDDNYIFLYLGYHLKEAELLDEFPRLYLNLRFIEKKIMNNCAADLLSDFDKYKQFITKEEDRAEERYDDFVRFIKKIGACKSISNSDIIQFALCEPKHSFVYEAAINMLRTTCAEKEIGSEYFELLTDIPEETARCKFYYPKEEIDVAVFVSDSNVIVANSNGDIKLLNLLNNLCTLVTFCRHDARVTHLQVNKNMFYFLSASEDTTIRVWNLALEKHIFEKPRTPSPQLKQEGYVDPWGPQRSSGEAPVAVLDQHNLPIKSVQFSNDGMMIVSCAAEYHLILWKFVVQKEKNSLTLHNHTIIPTPEPIYHCGFSNSDDLILSATAKGLVYVHERSNSQLIRRIPVTTEIKSVLILPDVNKLAILVLGKSNCYIIHPLEEQNATSTVFERSGENQFLISRRKEGLAVFGAVSWDNKYVAVAMDNFVIFVYEISTGQEVAKLNGNNGGIRCLSWSGQTYSLLAVYRNRTLKIWDLTNDKLTKTEDVAVTKLRNNIFDASWIRNETGEGDSDDQLLITVAVDEHNEIQIFYDLQLYKKLSFAPHVKSKINTIRFCPVFERIIYSCKDGSAFSVNFDQWIPHPLKTTTADHPLRSRIISFQLFSDADNHRSLTVLFINTAQDEFSLIGLLRCETDEEENEISYSKDSNKIAKCEVDWKTNTLYLIERNHYLKLYDINSGVLKKSYDCNLDIECCNSVQLCDISPDFSCVAVGEGNVIYLRSTSTGLVKHVWHFDDETPKTCKFVDENDFAVGFKDGLLQIYEVEHGNKRFSFPPKPSDSNSFKLPPGEVVHIVASPTPIRRVLVIYEREVVLFDLVEGIKIIAILCIDVDKVLYDSTFTKFVTIDSSGLFRVFRHPIIV